MLLLAPLFVRARPERCSAGGRLRRLMAARQGRVTGTASPAAGAGAGGEQWTRALAASRSSTARLRDAVLLRNGVPCGTESPHARGRRTRLLSDGCSGRRLLANRLLLALLLRCRTSAAYAAPASDAYAVLRPARRRSRGRRPRGRSRRRTGAGAAPPRHRRPARSGSETDRFTRNRPGGRRGTRAAPAIPNAGERHHGARRRRLGPDHRGHHRLTARAIRRMRFRRRRAVGGVSVPSHQAANARRRGTPPRSGPARPQRVPQQTVEMSSS